MALVVIRDPLTGVSFQAVGNEKAYLYTEDGSDSFSFTFAPSAIQYNTWEDDWVQVERVGLTPLLVRKAGKLDEIKFSINLGDKVDYFAEQLGPLAALKRIAQTRLRVVFWYSEHEIGLWRVTACSSASVLRHPVTNRIIRATADVTLTRANDPTPGVGPVSSPAPAAVAVPLPAVAPPARTVTVAAGDSLWALAQSLYGNGAAWPRLYDANRDKVTVPWLITPGTVLTVP